MATAAVGSVAPRKNGPALPSRWQDRFVAAYKKLGGIHLAAEAASISPETVRRYRASDPDFDQACTDAREFYADTLEVNMIASAERSDNPVPWIVRLKALRPHLYVEKHAVMNFSVSTELESADGLEALQMMFATMRPNTQALIQPREASSAEVRMLGSAGETGSAPHALASPPATTEQPA